MKSFHTREIKEKGVLVDDEVGLEWIGFGD